MGKIRNYKYPLSVEAGSALGKKSALYSRIYALETWAVRHGYKGYSRHNKRTNAQKALQQRIRF